MLKYVAAGTAAIAAMPAAAQDAGPVPRGGDGAEMTILVSGLPHPLDRTGQAVSVFDREAIEDVQGADLSRLLERAPGVAINRNGPPGAFTALHVRGSEGEQVLVLIDGVRVADPAAPGGGFDLGTLLMGNLARVELQRGSNSTIWGSDALGGLLAVTTGSVQPLSGSLEYGSYNTAYGTIAGSLGRGPAAINLHAAHYSSAGFSAAADGNEADGFRQTELAGSGTVTLSPNLSAFARARYAAGHLETDGFPAPAYTLADTAEYQDSEQASGVVGLRYTGSAFELTAAGSQARTVRRNFDPALGTDPTFTADGLSQRLEMRARWAVARLLSLDFGAEREWTRFATLFDARKATAIAGAYGQLNYDAGPLHFAAGVRRDDHRDFGGQWSVGADGAYQLVPGLTATASYGEGFKAPSLFQLRSDYGNPALSPERARSYDVGLRYGGRVAVSAMAFRRDTRDLISFVSCSGITTGICAARPFGTYDNIGHARAQGIELDGQAKVTRDVSLRGAYTYLSAVDRTPGAVTQGRDLARRPRHTLSMSGDWQGNSVRLGADLRVVSRSFDDAAGLTPLSGYAVATLRGEWDASRRLTLYGRVENLLDDIYQTAAGYATARRAIFIGARARR